MIEQLIHKISNLVHGLHHLVEQLEKDREERKHQLHKIMAAIDTLTGSVNNLVTADTDLANAVNAAVIQLGSPGATDAQILSLAGLVDTQTAKAAALTAALTAAVTPVTPPAPTP